MRSVYVFESKAKRLRSFPDLLRAPSRTSGLSELGKVCGPIEGEETTMIPFWEITATRSHGARQLLGRPSVFEWVICLRRQSQAREVNGVLQSTLSSDWHSANLTEYQLITLVLDVLTRRSGNIERKLSPEFGRSLLNRIAKLISPSAIFAGHRVVVVAKHLLGCCDQRYRNSRIGGICANPDGGLVIRKFQLQGIGNRDTADKIHDEISEKISNFRRIWILKEFFFEALRRIRPARPGVDHPQSGA